MSVIICIGYFILIQNYQNVTLNMPRISENQDNVRIQYEQLDQFINFTMFSTLNILHGNIVDLLYASIGYQFAGKSGDYFHQPFFKLKSQRWHEVIEAKRKKRKTWCNIFIRYRVYYQLKRIVFCGSETFYWLILFHCVIFRVLLWLLYCSTYCCYIKNRSQGPNG